jgi:hypothetical protein
MTFSFFMILSPFSSSTFLAEVHEHLIYEWLRFSGYRLEVSKCDFSLELMLTLTKADCR